MRRLASIALTPPSLLGLLGLLGCPSEPDPQPTALALIRSADWVRVTDPDADAFAGLRPADAVCDDAGWSVDPFAGVLEVDTQVCNYLTVGQTTLEPLAPGDVIEVKGYHDVLSSELPGAAGYLGLAIDGELIWALDVPIPSDAAPIDESFTVERSFAAGSDIQVHVHNHGPNTWELLSVEVTRAL